MKKTFAAALVLCMALGLSACGGSDGKTEAPKSTSAATEAVKEKATEGAAGSTEGAGQDAQVQESTWYFEKNGVKIHMKDQAAGIIAQLGEPRKKQEAESCAFDGMDYTYMYPGFDIIASGTSESDAFVANVILRDDTVGTPEGIYIGSDKAAVEKAYGKLAEGATNLQMKKENCNLLIILKEDVVSSIQYQLSEE